MHIVMESNKGNPHQKIWELLEHFNHLEWNITHKISDYLGILEEENIKILFNSTIIWFWGKVKLLINFKLYNNAVIEKLRELSNIRNGFAHAFLISQRAEYGYINWILDETQVFRTIEVMNKNSIIEERDLDEVYDRYFEVYEELVTLTI